MRKKLSDEKWYDIVALRLYFNSQERTLMESKTESEKNKNIVYVVDDNWVQQWVRYVIGDSPPPSDSIGMTEFNLRLC
jgi:hypothetical protein